MMNRRDFLSLGTKTAAAFGAGAVVGPIAAASVCQVRRQTITVAGLPAAFDGIRIAQLSDFHHSPWISQKHIASAVALANSLQPDLVAITGDFVDSGKEYVPGCIEELAKLQAPLGAVAVLGNHDHLHLVPQMIRQGLKTAGITDLTNTGIALRRDGSSLWVGGVGDLWTEKQNLPAALAGARTAKSALLLTHNPDFLETAKDERIGLALCGHTHGGQVVLPLIGAPIVSSQYGQKYLSGLCHAPVVDVFVTRGVGTIFPPVRFCCPAEVALLTLQRPGKTQA